MDRDARSYLWDVQQAAEAIGQFAAGLDAASRSSGNVFADLGFTPAEVEEPTAKSALIDAIRETIVRRRLTQQEAAKSAIPINRRFRRYCVAAWKA